MKSVVRPELSTASAGPSQAPAAVVNNSAPVSTHPEPTYKSGKAVQTTGTTSLGGTNSLPVERIGRTFHRNPGRPQTLRDSTEISSFLSHAHAGISSDDEPPTLPAKQPFSLQPSKVLRNPWSCGSDKFGDVVVAERLLQKCAA